MAWNGKSLCLEPLAPGQKRFFHKCVTPAGVCFLEDEVRGLCISIDGNHPWSGLSFDFEARVWSLCEAAAAGMLEADELVGPCATQPDVWEMHCDFDDDKYRLYFSEDDGWSPESRQPAFIGLHLHRKNIDGDAAHQRDLQNVEIAEAQNRYTGYSRDNWGHTKSCKHCVVGKGA